ncbi:MAG: class I SAM-dependent methyltransferase [Acidimicrobiia bacterium]
MSDDLFETMYRGAEGDAAAIPWAALSPNPFMADWLHGHSGPGEAVVVGCGLGDDAEAAAAQGWDVTAFDVAPSAIEWCKERFPGSSVAYSTQDLFDLPPHWTGSFSLVVEVLTVQSLEPSLQQEAIRRIAELVAPEGTLLVFTFGHDGSGERTGPPWPPARPDLETFLAAGLDQVTFTTRPSRWPDYMLIEAEYFRPPA